ncbi:DUF1329 domain-containing protein [Pelomonas sp. KK5]|uniref:DUF1329 domain-containing protein n=1 Tax=Pelomonas sp. KK5 TaxID=1855730 RepID=UPI00097C45FD|nr:DUF1329 domain-containing protein [Pelomonas sp. KK5]
MKTCSTPLSLALTLASILASTVATAPARAAVSEAEAARLASELTPLGGERAGNKAGTIPAWTGGYAATAAARITGRRPDPFAADKPLYTVTAANVAEHAPQLSDGLKAMFKKYPDFRLNVYPTRRTASAPAYVYENTRLNATRARLNADVLSGAFGGIPFPIPKTGDEAMWNAVMFWGGAAYRFDANGYLVTATGSPVLTVDVKGELNRPYYYEDGDRAAFEKQGGVHAEIKVTNSGPPVRVGEAVISKLYTDSSKDVAWMYLTGQRRVRKLPSACCDTPTPQTAGVMTFDEQFVFRGRLERFDWKVIGKQEMLIPYNANRLNVPERDADVLGKNFVNPDHLRWELHRVWVVEGTLRAGQRHTMPRSRYYLDEDTWIPVLADRWDAQGNLWRTLGQYPIVLPDVPATAPLTFYMHDLVSGAWYVNGLMNAKATPMEVVPKFSDSNFQPDSLAGKSVR